MTRIGTGFCVAAMLGCIATVGAQTPTSTDQRASTTAQSGDISITGCLAKGADGGYTLTNAQMDNQAGSTTGAATTTAGTSGSTTGSTTASGTTASGGTSTATTTGTSGSAGASSPASAAGMNAAATWVLSGGSDLDKHVGHKVQVTGKSASSSASAGTTGSTTAATGTTAGSTTGSATGTTGSSPSGSSSATSQHHLDVQSVKMIASTCS